MNTLMDYAVLPNRQLVELHLNGDRSAFRQIVERHQAMICALGLSACGDVARSEELAQEVFIAAWKQLPSLREPEKLRAWLAGIARNLINNSFRRQARTPTARAEPLSPETPAGEAGPREQAIKQDEAALMWHALEEIPENYREPMVLFYREQRSTAAVAAALEISEDAVRQRLARGRALLSERMAKLVEETLERSAPTPAFAGLVVLALPVTVGPVAIEAAIGAGGGAAAKTLTAAGAIGSAAAKGGLLFKFLSTVAFLPALLQGATDFIRFNERNAAQPDAAARREAAKAYLGINAGIGLFVLAFLILPDLAPSPMPVFAFAVIGLCAVAGIWFSIRANCRMKRMQGQLPVGFVKHRGFEQRSTGTFLGLPFYHVRLGTRPTRQAPAVKGWVAISDRWAVGGLFAFGPFAVAPFSMGVIGGGVISVSIVALGVLAALGIVAAGGLSRGLVAVGAVAAKGVMAAAPLAASLNGHFASWAGEAAAREFFQAHWFYRFTSVSAECLIWAGLLGWVMPVVLTGWQLWRTRTAR